MASKKKIKPKVNSITKVINKDVKHTNSKTDFLFSNQFNQSSIHDTYLEQDNEQELNVLINNDKERIDDESITNYNSVNPALNHFNANLSLNTNANYKYINSSIDNNRYKLDIINLCKNIYNHNPVFKYSYAFKKYGLTIKQHLFSLLFTSESEVYGNGVRSFIIAYNLDVVNDRLNYSRAHRGATRLLQASNILSYIDELISAIAFNDQFADKQLAFLMSQKAHLGIALSAVKEYNKLKQRIVTKIDQNNTFDFGDFVKQAELAEQQGSTKAIDITEQTKIEEERQAKNARREMNNLERELTGEEED